MIEDKLRTFIIEELNWNGTQQDLTEDYPLIDRHVVDSLGLFELVSFVEGEFGVEIRDEELVPENFGTIGDIVKFVDSKRGPDLSG
jgi:acyl carrier protein